MLGGGGGGGGGGQSFTQRMHPAWRRTFVIPNMFLVKQTSQAKYTLYMCVYMYVN